MPLLHLSRTSLLLLLLFAISNASLAQHTDSLTINFDFNASTIAPFAKQKTDSFFSHKKMASCKITYIALSGYCDTMGTSAYNEQLSRERITAVKNLLFTMGLDTLLVQQEIPYGESQQLCKNGVILDRYLNRRVVILVSEQPVDTIAASTGLPQTNPTDTLYNKIAAPETTVGSHIVLDNLLFYGNRSAPLPTSLRTLNELLRVMTEHKNLKIAIEGYVCCTPDDKDGMDADTGEADLSLQRAKYVYQYLVNHGIEKARLSFVGYGGAGKRYPQEENEWEKEQNRRVEVKIVEK